MKLWSGVVFKLTCYGKEFILNNIKKQFKKKNIYK